MTLTTTGPLVEHSTTPLLQHQLRPVSALVRELVRDLQPKPAPAPRPSTSEEARNGR